MNSAIVIDHASVSFRAHSALEQVSLRVREGAFLSIIGPNGAGKSTLLTVVNGLGRLRAGTVTVFGNRLCAANVAALRREIGYVPQHAVVDRRLPVSVKEAVMIGRFARVGLFRRWDSASEAAVQNALDLVGIRHLADKPAGHLSGGELQKVAVARALAQEPRIILLDEPTASLDPRAQHELIGLIERIYHEKKYTVLLVTHILSHIPPSCTDVVLMKQGQVIASGPAEALLTAAALSSLYDTPLEVRVVNGRRHFHTGDIHG